MAAATRGGVRNRNLDGASCGGHLPDGQSGPAIASHRDLVRARTAAMDRGPAPRPGNLVGERLTIARTAAGPGARGLSTALLGPAVLGPARCIPRRRSSRGPGRGLATSRAGSRLGGARCQGHVPCLGRVRRERRHHGRCTRAHGRLRLAGPSTAPWWPAGGCAAVGGRDAVAVAASDASRGRQSAGSIGTMTRTRIIRPAARATMPSSTCMDIMATSRQ